MISIFGEIIHSYTREEALNDGVLIDVSTLVSNTGFKYPVAFTSNLYSKIVDIPKEYSWQDVKGRINDILFMARIKARKAINSSFIFELILPHYKYNSNGDKVIANHINLKATCGPGDNLEPVITIMLVDED